MHALLQAIDNVQQGLAEDGPILIFEDDVTFYSSFRVALYNAIHMLNYFRPVWKLLAMDWAYARGRSSLVHNLLDQASCYLNNHAYVVANAATVQMLFDGYNAAGIKPADWAWHELAGVHLCAE